jgi:hypothetical protein
MGWFMVHPPSRSPDHKACRWDSLSPKRRKCCRCECGKIPLAVGSFLRRYAAAAYIGERYFAVCC